MSAAGQGFSSETMRTARTSDRVAELEGAQIVHVEGFELRAGQQLGFKIEPPPVLADGDAVVWDWDDGKREHDSDGVAVHRFENAGEYTVTAKVVKKDGDEDPVRAVTILLGSASENQLVVAVRRWRWAATLAVLSISLLLATISGLVALYFGKTFGAPTDYIAAVFWGFGLDSGVRGFTAIFKKLSTPEASA
jgi:hypothetical protein